MRLKLAVLLTYAALTILLTYPQVRGFGAYVPYHSDPYFSMWRLGWVAHALRSTPGALFESNIFYPEHDTLAYSDAMLLPGVALAPLTWAGVPPVITYNFALLGAFALSGLAMFLLARRLTESLPASLLAGMIYAFAPYRFSHYAHLELQMVFWLPVALLLIDRLLTDARLRDGVLLGLAMACQTFSCIYAAIFFLTYCVIVAPALAVAAGLTATRRAIVPALAGAVLALVIVAPYARVYMRAEAGVGARSIEDVRLYSASLTHYLSAPAMNRLYGWTAVRDRVWADEMNLFPGACAIALALVGLFAGRGRARLAYLAGLILAFDLTRGMNGLTYPWLFDHVPAFRMLRSAARMAILVNLSLAVLSAYGATFLLECLGRRVWKRAAFAAMGLILIAEYASAPELFRAPDPSNVDLALAAAPPEIIVELPLASPANRNLSRDFLFMYQGIPHFQKMLNGYSGYAPPSYYEMRDAMASFPDDRSMAFLRSRNVDLVVVRAGLYDQAARSALLDQLRQREDLALEQMWTDGPAGTEAIYRVRKSRDAQPK